MCCIQKGHVQAGRLIEGERVKRGLKHEDHRFLTSSLEAEELISGTPIKLRSCEMKIRIIGCRSDLEILYCDSEDMFLGGFLMVTPPQRGIKKELLRSGLPTERRYLLVHIAGYSTVCGIFTVKVVDPEWGNIC